MFNGLVFNNMVNNNPDESVYQLAEQQKIEIASARDEITKGEGIPAEQVDEEFDEWLNE